MDKAAENWKTQEFRGRCVQQMYVRSHLNCLAAADVIFFRSTILAKYAHNQISAQDLEARIFAKSHSVVSPETFHFRA